MNREIRIVSTKKLRPSQKQLLLNAGFSVVDANFIRITLIPFSLTGINQNLILTSQNAVKALANHPEVQQIRRNPVFCVGEKTADLLDEVGFTVLEIASSANHLAQVILEGYASESFTFFSGNLRRNELPQLLMEGNVELSEVEVYETELTPVKVLSGVDGVLFFSPSGVEGFCRENTIGESLCFCIGETTKSALTGRGVPSENIIQANQQTVESTIAKAVNKFSQMSDVERQTKSD